MSSAGGILRFQVRPAWQAPKWLPDQIALVAGYSCIAGTQGHDHHVFGRLSVPWPQINAEISLIGGMRYCAGYFESGLVGGRGDFESLRQEWGLHLHLASFFLGISRDH